MQIPVPERYLVGSHLTPLKGNNVLLRGKASDVSKYPHKNSSSKLQLTVPFPSGKYENHINLLIRNVMSFAHTTLYYYI